MRRYGIESCTDDRTFAQLSVYFENGVRSMAGSTALLVTRNSLLAREIHQIGSEHRGLRIETCFQEVAAEKYLQQGEVALLLLHLTSATEAAIMQLASAAADMPAPAATVVLAEPDCAHHESAVLDGGAVDFVCLPADLGRVGRMLQDAIAVDRCEEPTQTMAPVTEEPPVDPFFNVHAPEMVELMEQVRRVAPQDTTLLFTGETGTGKTRLARLVHEFSPRAKEPFLVVDCGALSANLIESEMFGHVRGAFTGADRDRAGKLAAAGKGTLLLDEVNSLPLPLQAKLLRAVDERVFEPVGSNKPQALRARLIAVSNTPLEPEVTAGRFRSDLYYRLNVVGFFLPPLRDRRSAIAPLAAQFVAEFAGRNRPDVRGLSAAAVRALEGYAWPGNVRELRNVIERAVALCPGPEVQPRDLPEAVRAAPCRPLATSAWPALAAPTPLPTQPATLAQTREETEIRRIQEALLKHRNNRRRAAAELGISRMALYKKLHKYGLMELT
jgi:two-component system response regulator HydG